YGRATLAFHNHQLRVARTLAEVGLSALADLEHGALTEDQRLLLAQLHFRSSAGCDYGEYRHRTRRARDLLAPIADRYPEEFIDIEGHILDGIGTDLQAVLDAVRRAHERRAALGWPLLSLAEAHRARGNIVSARRAIGEIPAAETAALGHTIRWLVLHFD